MLLPHQEHCVVCLSSNRCNRTRIRGNTSERARVNGRERLRAGIFQSSSSYLPSSQQFAALGLQLKVGRWDQNFTSPPPPLHSPHLRSPRAPAPATEGVVVSLSVCVRLGIACARWSRARAFHRGGGKKARLHSLLPSHIPLHPPAARLHALRKTLLPPHYSAARQSSSSSTIEAVHGSLFCIRQRRRSAELIRRHGTTAAA